LPYDVARLAQTRIVLLSAVRRVSDGPTSSPAEVITALQHEDNPEHRAHAKIVADFLEEMRARLTLLIPEEGADPYEHARDDRLTVLTMNGLTLPKDGVEREHWSDGEAMAVQLLNLAAWLTQRLVYDAPKDQRKGVWIDEAFFLSTVPTGRVLMNRFARDSRKWNVRCLLSSQVPEDFLRIPGFVSLLDSVFVGRLDDEKVQGHALEMLQIPKGTGYEAILGDLSRRPGQDRNSTVRDQSPRQFVFRDGNGGVEKIRIDFSGDHLAGLRRVLETAPDASKTVRTGVLAQANPDFRAGDPADQQPESVDAPASNPTGSQQ
ncbi:MAG: ATP-binding protein, partial [Mycobacterium sp.]|nr:ATP-binding protein [Mycobacterium sp.]